MIISHINGGLGNQLFQYAAGKALAEHHQVPFKIDKSYYSRINFRSFELENFNIKLSYASEDEIRNATNKNLLIKAYSKILPPHKKVIFTEPHFHFYNNFFKASPNSFLIGLWQSEKYFIAIKDIIRKEFTLKTELTNEVKKKGEEMRHENSVSVHIRRGDYENAKTQQYLRLQPVEYYQKALTFIQERVGDVKVYFFSDDINFVRKNLVFNNSHEFISAQLSKNHYEDFYLMQHCRHNIIANSTYSWWGAWLNGDKEKVVVAPKKWFTDETNKAPDLIPASWTKL